MTDAQALCGFKPPENFGDPDYQCRHPARQDGLCLFHLFKPTEEQKQAMAQEARTAAEAIEEEFRQAFSKLLEDEEKNPEAEVCDFRYFRFPTIYLSKRRFAKPLRLQGATFSGKADFWEAIFSGRADFGDATFKRVSFWEVTFSVGANFVGATFKRVSFYGATFSGKAHFVGATFKHVSFYGATFSGKATFQGETFKGVCLFMRVTLDERLELSLRKPKRKST